MPDPGRLIALEGGEATGKTTQARLLAGTLGALLTREPGGTLLGERVRSLLLEDLSQAPDPKAEALLMLAARAQHVAEVVAPALAAGRWVVTDRFVGSTLAYQGYGRGLDVGDLDRLSSWATTGLVPDLTVLLETDEAEVVRRQAGRPWRGDLLEREQRGFHEQVAAGYRALAQGDPDRWVVVEGAGPVDEVARRVRSAVISRLGPVPAGVTGRG